MDILRTVRDRQSRIDPDLLPDPLTGLYSQQAFIRSGQAELARARLRGNPVTVMMIQIDGFDPLGATQGTRSRTSSSSASRPGSRGTSAISTSPDACRQTRSAS